MKALLFAELNPLAVVEFCQVPVDIGTINIDGKETTVVVLHQPNLTDLPIVVFPNHYIVEHDTHGDYVYTPMSPRQFDRYCAKQKE